jgi:hypothetical protein
MASNTEIEQQWIDAWNEVHNIVRDQRNAPCQLSESSVVTVDDCLGWLQNSVYECYLVRIESGWVGHKRGVIAHRWRADA